MAIVGEKRNNKHARKDEILDVLRRANIPVDQATAEALYEIAEEVQEEWDELEDERLAEEERRREQED